MTAISRASTALSASADRPDERSEVLRVVLDACQSAYWGDDPEAKAARNYVARRGLSDDHARDFGLGYFSARIPWLVPAHLLAAFRRLAVVNWHGRIVVPWHNVDGGLLTLYSRIVEIENDGESQDQATPDADETDDNRLLAAKGVGSKRSPFLFDRALRDCRDQHLMLVEGVFDALVLHANGATDTISPVSNRLSFAQVETLRDHCIRRVTVCLDPDGGGATGTPSCVRALQAAGIEAWVAPQLPDGLDPDEFVLRHGISEWRRHVAQATRALSVVTPKIVEPSRPDDATDAPSKVMCGEFQATTATGPEMSVLTSVVLDHFTVNQVLVALGEQPTDSKGRRSCPIHRGSNPSTFAADAGGLLWHCFKCGAKGNAIDLAACLRGESYAQTRDWLLSRLQEAGGDPLPVTPDPDAVIRRGLTTPGATLLDRSPPGAGKTTRVLRNIGELLAHGVTGRTGILSRSHDHADEELLPRLPIAAKMPRMECPAGRTDELEAAVRAGWSYAVVVCSTCDERTDCTLYAERERAASAPVVVGMHAHFGGLCALGNNVERLIVDEDPLESLAPLVHYSHDSAAFLVDKLERHIPDLACAMKAAVAAISEVSTEAGVRAVPPPGDDSWRLLLDDAAMMRAAVRLHRTGGVVRNMLPVLRQAALDWGAGRPFVLFAHDDRHEAVLRRKVPDHVSLVVLDGTGQSDVIAALTNRTNVEVINSNRKVMPKIEQIATGGMRSRTQLGPKRGGRGLLEQDARVIADKLKELLLPKGARVGVITYLKQVDHLVAAIRPEVRTLQKRTRGLYVPEFEIAYWGNLRGTNAMQGTDLIIIHGTPTPHLLAVKRLALVLGASPDELREKAVLTPVVGRGRGAKVYAYKGERMERARTVLLEAEFEQALGRGARWDWTPKHGLLVLSSHPVPRGFK